MQAGTTVSEHVNTGQLSREFIHVISRLKLFIFVRAMVSIYTLKSSVQMTFKKFSYHAKSNITIDRVDDICDVELIKAAEEVERSKSAVKVTPQSCIRSQISIHMS